MSRARAFAAVTASAWCAGTVVLGALAAPKIFAAIGAGVADKTAAGALFGAILISWSVAGWVFLGALLLGLGLYALELRERGRAGLMALCLAALVGSVVLQWTGSSLIRSVQETAKERREKPGDAELEARFTQLHERSTQVVKLHTVLLAGIALGLILLNGASAEKKPE